MNLLDRKHLISEKKDIKVIEAIETICSAGSGDAFLATGAELLITFFRVINFSESSIFYFSPQNLYW
jgi:hypothetical protein